jgi:hypothetical protein
MRTPYVFANEIRHSMLRQQHAGWAGGQTAAQMQRANKGLHLISEIWQNGELISGVFFSGAARVVAEIISQA